jgi:hypothetical protein
MAAAVCVEASIRTRGASPFCVLEDSGVAAGAFSHPVAPVSRRSDAGCDVSPVGHSKPRAASGTPRRPAEGGNCSQAVRAGRGRAAGVRGSRQLTKEYVVFFACSLAQAAVMADADDAAAREAAIEQCKNAA